MKRILIWLIIFGLVFVNYELSYSQSSKLTIPADVTTDTAIFNPQSSAPGTCDATRLGQIYYNSTDKKFYHCNGSAWGAFGGAGGGNKTVATLIVAASDSQDQSADYVCPATGAQVTIQSAIDALPATGGVIYLKEGTYSVSSSININKSNVSLIGTGAATVLQASSGGVNPIYVYKAGSTLINILIQNLKVIGGSTGTGIQLTNVQYSKIDKTWVESSSTGVKLAIASYNTISANTILNCNYGIWVETTSINTPSTYNTITGNLLSNNYQYGIAIRSTDSSTYRTAFNTVTANVVEKSIKGLMLYYSDYNSVTGNVFSKPGYPTGYSGTDGDGIYLEYSNYNTFTGNTVDDPRQHAFSLSIANNNTFTGNSAYQYPTVAIGTFCSFNVQASSYNNFTGNYSTIGSGSSSAIVINAFRLNNSNNNVISGNFVSSGCCSCTSGTYGIYIGDSFCNNNYLVGNAIEGMGYQGCLPTPIERMIYDAGTGTKYTQPEKIGLDRTEVVVINGSTLDVNTSPKAYVILNSNNQDITLNSTTSIADGRAVGDMLILEGPTSNHVTIDDATNVRLKCPGATNPSLTLHAQDTVVFIWDGIDWIEITQSDN